MKKDVIVARYKSEIIEYLQKESILREDVQMVCTPEDLRDLKDIGKVVILSNPWYGFEESIVFGGKIAESLMDSNDMPVDTVKVEVPVSDTETEVKEFSKPDVEAMETPVYMFGTGDKIPENLEEVFAESFKEEVAKQVEQTTIDDIGSSEVEVSGPAPLPAPLPGEEEVVSVKKPRKKAENE